MKKLILVMLVLIVPSMSATADVAKVDPFLKMASEAPSVGKAFLGKAVSIQEGRELIDCLVKSTDTEATTKAITQAGGNVRAVLGKIMVAWIPSDVIESISDREEVAYIEAAKPMTTKMNAARAFTHVTELQDGTLGTVYKGKNVLVGAVDSDLDWQNDDFKGADGKTRICYLQQQIGSVESGEEIECTKAQIDDSSCEVTRGGGNYHGTHVMGIEASQDTPYTGVAPEAFIAFSFFNSAADADTSGTFSTTILEGVNTIFEKADDLDMPAVVNLSVGTSLGAHDDTSLLEQGLKEAITDGSSQKEGRILVNAAGNETINIHDDGYTTPGLGGIHAPIDVDAGNDRGWRVYIRDSLLKYGGAIVDVWLDDTDECRASTLEVMAYKRNTTERDTSLAAFKVDKVNFDDDAGHASTNDDDTADVTVLTSKTNTRNNRPEGLIAIAKTAAADWSEIYDPDTGYDFDVIIRTQSGNCQGDMWLYPDATLYIDFRRNVDTITVTGTGTYQLTDGDSTNTTTIPGTASAVITVGSYMGRASWKDIDDVTQYQTDTFDPDCHVNCATEGTVDLISLFSSLGPTSESDPGDRRFKPDIVAPGEPIISTRASGFGVSLRAILGDADHWKLQGTSMASPHVAGIVGLLLQKNSCLTKDEVWTALTSTAVHPTPYPDNVYGYGKVDALAAMRTISSDSCYKGTTCTSSNHTTGKGCSGMMIPVSTTAGVIGLATFAIPIGILIIKRRRRNKSSTI